MSLHLIYFCCICHCWSTNKSCEESKGCHLAENSIPGTCDCHTHPDPGACSQQLNSHIFQTNGSRSSTSDIALYFIYHISSIHLIEWIEHSFLIIQDNCSNISLPAWFHMAHHRIQSNKCAYVGTKQFRETVRKFSESKTRLWTTGKTKLYHISHTEKLPQLLLLGKQSWSLTLWLQHIVRISIKGQCDLELNTPNSLSLLSKGVLGPGSPPGHKAELLRLQNRG